MGPESGPKRGLLKKKQFNYTILDPKNSFVCVERKNTEKLLVAIVTKYSLK